MATRAAIVDTRGRAARQRTDNARALNQRIAKPLTCVAADGRATWSDRRSAFTRATLGLLSQNGWTSRSTGRTPAATCPSASSDDARISRPVGAERATRRSLIRLTVDAPGENIEHPKRGYRRIAWIERAIAPLRSELDEAAFERLVSALAMVVGWEALIVLQDLRGLPTDEQTRVSIWAARALIQAALDDQASQTTSMPSTANPATRAGDADRDSQTDERDPGTDRG